MSKIIGLNDNPLQRLSARLVAQELATAKLRDILADLANAFAFQAEVLKRAHMKSGVDVIAISQEIIKENEELQKAPKAPE